VPLGSILIAAAVALVDHDNADTRVEWNGLSYRCLPYNQRWTHWESVKYVKKTSWDYLYFSVTKLGIRCVVYLLRIFKMFHGIVKNPVFI
jgi:hypothetical protein